MRRGHLFIEGKVQNVGFRHFTKLNAEEVGVHGWVKNLPDGRVEVIFEGPEDHIDEIVARCEDGPGASRVDEVDFEWEEPTGEFNSFEIAHY
jgi:acylphosphatase